MGRIELHDQKKRKKGNSLPEGTFISRSNRRILLLSMQKAGCTANLNFQKVPVRTNVYNRGDKRVSFISQNWFPYKNYFEWHQVSSLSAGGTHCILRSKRVIFSRRFEKIRRFKRSSDGQRRLFCIFLKFGSINVIRVSEPNRKLLQTTLFFSLSKLKIFKNSPGVVSAAFPREQF